MSVPIRQKDSFHPKMSCKISRPISYSYGIKAGTNNRTRDRRVRGAIEIVLPCPLTLRLMDDDIRNRLFLGLDEERVSDQRSPELVWISRIRRASGGIILRQETIDRDGERYWYCIVRPKGKGEKKRQYVQDCSTHEEVRSLFERGFVASL